ncbi:hypothetical protein D924_01757 [Enterococcus faecalis 06-MB-S-10]|nr:hypothetical protein D927_00741 [Enterococcus faecalis 02-MB-BW-10]EPH84181.1 hypothetical protein D924_01757 [Enterococcus faecalis 06-MB-S-10]EPH88565.1 hypothetical protein D923_02024 [Enterococcus faecalis 06-MB-S-04]
MVKSCLTVFLNSRMPKQFLRNKKKPLIKRKIINIAALFILTKVRGGPNEALQKAIN